MKNKKNVLFIILLIFFALGISLICFGIYKNKPVLENKTNEINETEVDTTESVQLKIDKELENLEKEVLPSIIDELNKKADKLKSEGLKFDNFSKYTDGKKYDLKIIVNALDPSFDHCAFSEYYDNDITKDYCAVKSFVKSEPSFCSKNQNKISYLENICNLKERLKNISSQTSHSRTINIQNKEEAKSTHKGDVYIIIGVVVDVLVIFIFSINNSLVRLDNKVEEAFAMMDIYLKKRWDLIPNIVESVKGYAKHEKGTLEKIAGLRCEHYDKLDANEKLKKSIEVDEGISKLFAIVENYPELKANNNFNNLTKELSSAEDEIAYARKYYNASVRRFNDKVEIFPSNIFANILGYKTKSMFEINKDERENIKVDI